MGISRADQRQRDPDEVWASPVTPNLFQVLGVNAFLGRMFAPNETQAVVLSHQYWRGHFESDPRILGKVLALDGRLYRLYQSLPRTLSFRQPTRRCGLR